MLGLFDSGVGGLTVLSAIRDVLPDIDIVYLGDSERAPYGNRSRDTITAYTKQCCEELFDRGCILVILACNTASAGTLRTLQQSWLKTRSQDGHDTNILGVIHPLAEEAIRISMSGRVAVAATRATVESRAYTEVFEKLKPGITVIEHACPLLASLIEEGMIDKPETRMILKKYLRPVKERNPDVLILASTHYAPLRRDAERMMGKRCVVLDSPSVVARSLKQYLERHPEYSDRITRNGKLTILTTGNPDRFAEVGERMYGKRMTEVERIVVNPKSEIRNLKQIRMLKIRNRKVSWA